MLDSAVSFIQNVIQSHTSTCVIRFLDSLIFKSKNNLFFLAVGVGKTTKISDSQVKK